MTTATATATRTRRHNCQAETNVRMVSCEWVGEVIVTTWACRRCGSTWCTGTTPEKIEAERLARLYEQHAEVVARWRAEREQEDY